EKKFDAIRFAWGVQLDPDPYQIWHSSQMMEGGDNFISYSNLEVDRLIEQLRETLDDEERWRIGREIHRLLHEDQPVTFMFGFEENYFYDRDLRGVKLYPHVYPHDFAEWYW